MTPLHSNVMQLVCWSASPLLGDKPGQAHFVRQPAWLNIDALRAFSGHCFD